MPLAVISVASRGLPVSQATTGLPVIVSTSGFGLAVTTVASGGLPVVDTSGTLFSGIRLSNATFVVGSATSSAIGTLSVVGGSGTYTFSLTDSASNKVQVAGANGVNLQVGASAATVGSFSITVTTTGGAPNFTQSFLITVLPIAPSNSGGANLPTLSGSTVVGNTISTTSGTWAGNPVPTYSYQWKSAGVNVGTNTFTYVTTPGDVGNTITCTVTATNVGGIASATTAATAAITGSIPANAGGGNLPVISGSTTAGALLTTTSGTWTGSPAPTYAYQWKSGGVNVGTNATTYTTVGGDIGNTITVVVTATNVMGSANATSAAYGPIVSGAGGATPTYEIYFF